MLDMHRSPGESVVAFHIRASRKSAKTSCGELSGGEREERTQAGRETSPSHLLTSAIDHSLPFPRLGNARADSESAGSGLGNHGSPEDTEGQE